MILNPNIAWDEYISLEDDFIQYLRYVPLTTEHYNVWSLRLGDLLIRIGSILDSFLRRSMFSPELNKAIDIETYRKLDDRKINMGTYKMIFDPFYELSSKKIYDLHTFTPLTPFSNWKSDQSPEWWKAYNHVKHDRFKNKTEATLKFTFDALGGLFLLNVLHLDTMPLLVDYDIIKSKWAKGYLKEILSKKEPLSARSCVYAKTKMFGYVFDVEDMEYLKSEISQKDILSPSFGT